VKFWDLLSLVYNKDQANGEGAKTAAESSKEMAKENDTGGKDAPYSVSSSSSLKRQRSDDSFNSIWCDKFDMLTSALKDDCWGPSASEGPQKQDLTVFLEYNV
jgi:hypothetical protein